MGVECWTCPGEWGVGQGAKLSAPNSQWNARKTAKAKSGGGATSHPPREATSTKQKLRKAPRLRVWVGQQANLPKQGRWWIAELIYGTEKSIQRWIAPPCWGRSWPNRASAEGQFNCNLTTLHELAIWLHLTIPINLVDRRTKYYSKSQSPGETTSEFPLVCQYQDEIPPTCHHTISPSYTLPTHWLSYCTSCTQSQSPAIRDTSTLQYKNRNTPKHAPGPQNPATPIPLPPPAHSFFWLPFYCHLYQLPNMYN
jgi:hypothetical protein